MQDKTLRQIVVFVSGMAVILFGTALLVLPGPGLVTIALGLALLATEFSWAKKIIEPFSRYAKDATSKAMDKLRERKRR